jgi:hypothetical protein
MEEGERGCELIVPREDGDLAEIADEQVSALCGIARALEAAGDGVEQDAFLHAGAQIAEDDFCGVGGFAGVNAAGEEVREDFGFALDGTGGGEVIEEIGKVA